MVLPVTLEMLNAWIAAVMWPFARIGAMLLATPVFGNGAIPVRVRIGLALVLALMVAPMIEAPVEVSLLSFHGVYVLAQQVLIGVTIGFVLQLIYSAMTIAGEAIALSMGLGFASMVDPDQGVSIPLVSHFFGVVTTLVFLAMNGHVALISLIVDSFTLLPVTGGWLPADSLWALVSWGSTMFANALLVALPAMCALLVANVSMGVMTRAAPQLNIFAVGFPMTLTLGFVVLLLALPGVVDQMLEVFNEGFLLMRALLG